MHVQSILSAMPFNFPTEAGGPGSILLIQYRITSGIVTLNVLMC